MVKLEFTLNGKPASLDAPADITLLQLLRDYFSLTGSKPGCEVGECGACSVILDREVVNACLVLAPQVLGREVVTIEGIHAADGGPDDLQRSLIEHGAVQCGYCSPGMVMAGEALLAHEPEPTREQIREAIAGNLCRCTGYQQIVDAIQETAERRRSARQEVTR
ncbi:MAG: (2Fe-2S)-binding protein [Chloroflexi bacterium]|nr:(2Fe-2S)-binding protein [Chloroflexota bacterium]